jgi:hypothetical protein
MRTPAPEPSDPRRELARRESGGVEVALYWNPDDDTTSIEIWQADSELTLRFDVPPDRALDAFHHPFAELDAALGEVTVYAS